MLHHAMEKSKIMDPDDCHIKIQIAGQQHVHFAEVISETMAESARIRGTGIAKRSPETLKRYITEGNAVIAISETGEWAGFCYLAAWDKGQVVSNSGLIVSPRFRDCGVAKRMKTKLLHLSLQKYPDATIVGFTTSAAVMKINSALGFHATTFSDMAKDERFWDGCRSCVNHDILSRTGHKYCLCTAMAYNNPGSHRLYEQSRQQVLSERL
jgi:hypothetical protein